MIKGLKEEAMKKSPKKLTLDRETLRRLEHREALLQVKGAAGENLAMAEDQSVSCLYCHTVAGHSC
jgi:hypothetical protein